MVVSSLLGRLITGPVAFLAAGVYDFTAFFVVFAWRSVRGRVARAGGARAGRG